MRNAAVINCSKVYNLGTKKLTNWLRAEGYTVHDKIRAGVVYDLIALSVIFSWDAPFALQIAMQYKDSSEVWAGGPGLYVLRNWWHKETGLECQVGVDDRFENMPGTYLMTFASRGCPVGCSFCLVPRIEGREFSLNWDFIPAPRLGDSNLSALPVEFQDHIIRRYKNNMKVILDANSGFEPHSFDDETYRRWKVIMRGPWRLAYDETKEGEAVHRMMQILRNESADRKRVYVLIGNEPITQCYERIQQVLAWGGEPHVQPMIALNALEKRPIVRHDWTEQKLHDMARWANRWLWRNIPLKEYAPRKNEDALFAGDKL
jgi:hypothetical protein